MSKSEKTFYDKKKIKLRIEIFTFLVLVYIGFFSLFFENSINIYAFLNEVLCAVIAFSIGLICFFNRDLRSGQFYKNIGAGFWLISIVSFIYLFMYRNCIFTSYKIYIEDGFIRANYYLEYLIIIVAYMLTKINRKIKYEFLVAILIPAGILFFVIVTYAARYIRYYNIISRLIIFFILALDIRIILFNKIGLRNNEKKALLRYIFLIAIYQGLSILYSTLGEVSIAVSLTLKTCCYYIVFVLISKFVMKKSYLSMKKELTDVQKTQKELNNILKSRNRTLVELEHIIEKSSKRYSDLIEHVSDGIAIFYFNNIYYINTEAEKMLGDDIADKHDITFEKFTGLILEKNNATERYKFVKNNIKLVIDSKKDNFKFNLCNDSGKQFEVYLFNIDCITRFVYMKDVTEINRNYEFRRKYKEYLKCEEAKNEFYSNISHELRTPINLIYSALQLSEINLNDDKIKNLDKHNDTIKHNCLRLIRTINNFIDANKISEGFLVPDLKVYNIVSVVENISLACDRYMKKINNDLIFDAEEEELYVECDKEMIERVVLNILSNSMKFGKNGGRTTVNVTADHDLVIIHIGNNGYIVCEEEKPYIFDKFTKINKSLNRTNEGSGLGLYLSKALVELNKGRIELESDKDIGTDFIIRLPRCYREDECELEDNFEMIDQLSEKVDIEFSDIYI